ncbi:MAG: prephenate dehydratase [Anaerolineae bacterium]|nr:prephenate dehydratase [Anaerolineae bacterium]
MTRVAFQGEQGAYSEEAVRQHFGPDVAAVPQPSFRRVFDAVERGDSDYGMLPIENSVAGSVIANYDLLLESDLKIEAEVFVRVRHHLLAPEGTTAADIRVVRSHPQALAQCERYLASRGWDPQPVYDTAGAAKDLAAQPEPGVAAIASRLAGEIYGLQVLDAGIEDYPFNFTRFFVLGRATPAATEQSKTSLVLALPHHPGALYECLGEFATRGINLSKLESRPRRNRPWEYVFYIDFEGHPSEPRTQEAMLAVLGRAAFVKVLGSYPAASLPD